MAQKTIITLTDDIDGGEADETVKFALDGKSYEIDLTTANADKLRDALEPFTKSGRKVKSSARGVQTAISFGGTRKGGQSGASEDTAKIRAWAKENGYEVNDRGRVPATVREAYEKRTPATAASPTPDTTSEVPEGQEAIELEPPTQKEPAQFQEPVIEPEAPQAAGEPTAPAKKAAAKRTPRKKPAPPAKKSAAPEKAQS